VSPEGYAAIASAIATVAAAVAAAGSLLAAWKTLRMQDKSTDFSNCLEIIRQISEAQRRVISAESGSEKCRFEFIELLNLLESIAFLHNRGQMRGSTKLLVAKFLQEALAWFRTNPDLLRLIEEAATSKDTFRELNEFEQQYAGEMLDLTRRYIIEQSR